MALIKDKGDEVIKHFCPSVEELNSTTNQVQCEKCNLIFDREPRLRLHDLKVHQHQNQEKTFKEIIRYHCPVKNCIYTSDQRYFKLYKYLKQHYLKVHAEKKFKCTQCTKSFATNSAKEAHIRICGTSFICECQKIYNSYEALLTHAKRKSHKVDNKYKLKRVNRENAVNHNIFPTTMIYVLTKQTCDVAIQTDEIKIKRKSKSPKNKNTKEKICRQTQTSDAVKEKQIKISTETQTAKAVSRLIRVHKVAKSKKISIDKQSVIREDISLVETLSSEHLLPNSPCPLKHDIILQDLWEERSTLGTQTSPDKNIFSDVEDYSLQNATYGRMSRSDPMLTEKTFTDRFSSIETQTEEEYCRSIFESDPLSSNNETQTTENFTEAIEPLHIYNNTYTQTCDEIFSTDLELTDIQTQTAWSHLDESTVSTETQTKALKCISGCNDSNSWFTAPTNHMETQTDLLDIFEDLR